MTNGAASLKNQNTPYWPEPFYECADCFEEVDRLIHRANELRWVNEKQGDNWVASWRCGDHSKRYPVNRVGMRLSDLPKKDSVLSV